MTIYITSLFFQPRMNDSKIIRYNRHFIQCIIQTRASRPLSFKDEFILGLQVINLPEYLEIEQLSMIICQTSLSKRFVISLNLLQYLIG